MTIDRVGSTSIEGRCDGAIQAWLAIVACLVLLMIAVGGATRLTDSGLSITEWKPILGAIPPLTGHDWQDAFAKYQQIPEYHRVNKGMSLEDFKFIFWWEWAHRFLGRLIGIAFAGPLAFFWYVGALRPGQGARLVGVLALGALQGAIGWYMVMSGLVERVDVSHYRLALHLSVAFVILGLLVWLAMDAGRGAGSLERDDTKPRIGIGVPALITALVFFQVVLGAFVAGLKAGLIYNTWPTMDGHLVPPDILAMQPWYVNLVENPAMAQFNHRLVAYGVLALAVFHAWSVARSEAPAVVRGSALLLAGVVLAQAGLGIMTLWHGVPIGLGIAHQAGGAIVLAIAVRHAYIAAHGPR